MENSSPTLPTLGTQEPIIETPVKEEIKTPDLAPEELEKAPVVQGLIKESHVSMDFYLLLIAATTITTIGLLLDSTAVVIGGMLLAPLLSPILALGLGVVTANPDSLKRSLSTIGVSVGIVLLVSLALAFFLGVENIANSEIVQRLEPSLLYMYIALLSGAGATYAWAKPKLSANLPSIAVVVALLPPLCVTGIGISVLDRTMITGSFQLFFVNLIGITVSSAIVFSLFGFHTMRYVEKEEIVKEEALEQAVQQ